MYNLEGTTRNNIIIYNDGTYNNEVRYDKEVSIHRYNNEVDYKLIFNKNSKTHTKYLLKEYDRHINIYIETEELSISKNSIEIKYKQIIDNQEQNYKYILRWEEKK